MVSILYINLVPISEGTGTLFDRQPTLFISIVLRALAAAPAWGGANHGQIFRLRWVAIKMARLGIRPGRRR